MYGSRFADVLLLAQETGAGGDAGGDAGGGAGAGAGGGGGMGGILFPLLMIFAIFYFLIIRPESKKRKAREAKVRQMQKGDQVMTNGGIYGSVR